MAQTDTAFTGSIPALYDRLLGPLLFAPYAADMAARLAPLPARAVLETACGTGILSRALRRALPAARLVATDLNQAMLDHASRERGEGIEWRQADALALPFPDAQFDIVACQFGAMFFPDRTAGYREALRVLRPGGRLAFSVWGSLAENPMTAVVMDALAKVFPEDPPSFMARIPHGYCDPERIRADVAAAGGRTCAITEVRLTGHAASARDAAIGLCQGTPLRGEIAARDPARLAEATEAAAAALAARYGTGPIAHAMLALVVMVER